MRFPFRRVRRIAVPPTMSSLSSSLMSVLGLSLLLGCSGSTSSADAAADMVVVDAADAGSDAVTDTGPQGDVCRPNTRTRDDRSPRGLYGPCNSDDECREGFSCLTAAATGLPGGQCNLECTRNDDCVIMPAGGKPIDGYCLAPNAEGHRRCARICLNGADCARDGYTCRAIPNTGLTPVQVCIGVCTDDSCIDGTTCDHASGRCRPDCTPTPPGREVGQSCLADTNPMSTPETRCRSGLCNAEVVNDSAGVPIYTGNVGGFCLARCSLPSGYNSSTLWPDTAALPQSNCPDHSVCFPNGSLAEGDLGTCLAACSADSDCRMAEGYFCHKTFTINSRSRTFGVGFCEPFDCAAMPTRRCPTGYTCRSTRLSSGAVQGDCVPATTMM